MKRALLIFPVLVFTILLTGCKKNSFDPFSKEQNEFIGTWKGTITTFKNNQLVKETGYIMIYPEEGGSRLGGVIMMKEIRTFTQFQFQNGTLYFNVINNDPANPVCQNWTLGGYASFTDESTLSVRISGNECGYTGGEYVDWGGSMARSTTPADSLRCFTFAAQGNNWTYRTVKRYFDTCQVQKAISAKTGSYTFSGNSTHSCGWDNASIPLKYVVNPSEFTISDDVTLTLHAITIPVYAKPNVTYRKVFSPDTVTITLLDTNIAVVVPAGNFRCNFYRFTEPVLYEGLKITRTAYFWIGYHEGIIRYEVSNPQDSSDVRKMELVSATLK